MPTTQEVQPNYTLNNFGLLGRLHLVSSSAIMVHCHMPDPEEMEEEIAMLALMAAAIAYRIFGGQNEWLRTHGTVDS